MIREMLKLGIEALKTEAKLGISFDTPVTVVATPPIGTESNVLKSQDK